MRDQRTLCTVAEDDPLKHGTDQITSDKHLNNKMVFLVASYIFVTLCAKWIAGKGKHI